MLLFECTQTSGFLFPPPQDACCNFVVDLNSDCFFLPKVFNDSVIEITITISSAYITYYLAEITFHVSGVLAVVALGTVLSANKVAISPEVEEFVHRLVKPASGKLRFHSGML